MPEPLWLMVCENLRREAETILASEEFEGVSLATYTPSCGLPSLAWTDLETALRKAGWERGQVHVLGSGCLLKLGEPPPTLPANVVCSPDHCGALFVGQTFVEHCLGRNAFLMTPGWVEQWQHYMKEWGLNASIAHEFFGETTALLILLDTGVSDDSDRHLRECAEFVGLPCETVPIGLDFFRLYLAKIMGESRLRTLRSSTLEEVAKASGQAADILMTLDLIGNLTGVMTEEEAVQKTLDLFTTLFAPSTLLIAPVEDGCLTRVRSRPADLPSDAAALQQFCAGGEEYARTAGGTGFSLRISHRNQTLGIIVVDGIRFPEHRERYIGVARAVANVCGLALSNARAYEALGITVRDLQGALDNVKVLKGMIPICAGCKKIRDDRGYWQAVEVYVRDHTEATFSHGMCPECAKEWWQPEGDAQRRMR